MSEETKPVESKPQPTTPREKLLAHFDEILDQLGQYHAKFDDHVKAMDAEKEKVLAAKKSLGEKLEQVSELREYIEKKVK
jgi:hypothetical protein